MLFQRFGISVARGIVENVNMARVVVCNFSNEGVTLIPGTVVGRLNRLKKEDIKLVKMSEPENFPEDSFI